MTRWRTATVESHTRVSVLPKWEGSYDPGELGDKEEMRMWAGSYNKTMPKILEAFSMPSRWVGMGWGGSMMDG